MVQHLTQNDAAIGVEKIVREHVGSADALSPETHLQDELDIDSLERVEIGVKLEKTFSILLSNSTIQSAVTLGDFIHLVTNAQLKNSPTRTL